MKKFVLPFSIFILLGPSLISADLLSTSEHIPSSISADATIGVLDWANTVNACLSDNTYASATTLVLGAKTKYMKATGFGFSIPLTATITGIEVVIEKGASGVLQKVRDESIRIVKEGNIVGNDLAKSDIWSFSDSKHTHGSSSEKWGTDWTAEDINHPNFGIAISVNLSGISVLPSARIDYVSIKVYYNNPLPIKMVAFELNKHFDQAVQLRWTTSAEINNDFFEVQRSTDGVNWMKREELKGAGNSSQLVQYSFHDKVDFSGWVYYRIKQVDFDGAFEYSDTKAIEININTYHNTIYPNPSIGRINIPIDEKVGIIKIYNSSGRLILKEIVSQSSLVSIDIGDSSKGLHIAQLESSNGELLFKEKFVIQ